MSVGMRFYRWRLRPNGAQTAALDAMLRDFCGAYDACLQQRIEAHRCRVMSLRYGYQASESLASRTDDLYRTTRNVRVRTRARIILPMAEPRLTASEFAAIVRKRGETVRCWVQRYEAEGSYARDWVTTVC